MQQPTTGSEPEQKGEYMGNCNRTACQKPPAEYYNHSTRKYYCKECATLINAVNRADAWRMFGHDLCTNEQPLNANNVKP